MSEISCVDKRERHSVTVVLITKAEIAFVSDSVLLICMIQT